MQLSFEVCALSGVTRMFFFWAAWHHFFARRWLG
jgi:hypothetical protein